MSNTDRYLTLSKCSNLGCTKKPYERRNYILNKLTMKIRGHIHQFYSGYVSCEDPACTGRTRQLPLAFRGAFPVCSGCEKAIMTKEYSDKQLYTQLLYYQQLFDLKKVDLRYGAGTGKILLDKQPGLEEALSVFHAHVSQTMKENNYSVIDMEKLFGGFFFSKASKFKM